MRDVQHCCLAGLGPASLAALAWMLTACATVADHAAADDPCAPQRTAIYEPPVTVGGSGQVRVIEIPSACQRQTELTED